MSTPGGIDFRVFDDEVIGLEQWWKVGTEPEVAVRPRTSAGTGPLSSSQRSCAVLDGPMDPQTDEADPDHGVQTDEGTRPPPVDGVEAGGVHAEVERRDGQQVDDTDDDGTA